MTKTRVFYDGQDPFEEGGIKLIAIERDGDSYRVFATYGIGLDRIPSYIQEHPDLSVLPIEKAVEKYDFEKAEGSTA